MNLHSILLETYFFEFIDRDVPIRTTPLLTGVFEGESLSEHLAGRFGLSKREAEVAIEAVRREVKLPSSSLPTSQ